MIFWVVGCCLILKSDKHNITSQPDKNKPNVAGVEFLKVALHCIGAESNIYCCYTGCSLSALAVAAKLLESCLWSGVMIKMLTNSSIAVSSQQPAWSQLPQNFAVVGMEETIEGLDESKIEGTDPGSLVMNQNIRLKFLEPEL